MKVYGGMNIQIHIFLTSSLAGGGGQLHAPVALHPEKDPPVPTGEEAEWSPEPV
jgi:hypothetical protein